ncbi:MAG: glycosylase [Verrucomicrobia bacterium]|nr:glycosylase [Verrucomicrobiota bacterium]
MSSGTVFHWEKLGQVFQPRGQFDWMQTHAQNPTILELPDRLRVYFTCRPKADARGNFASVTSFVEVDRRDPLRVLRVNDRPVLTPGGLGCFDQFGVMPGAVVRFGNEVWLYYVGWMRCSGAPFAHAIGVAVSKDGGVTFARLGRGPVVTRTVQEPFLQNSPVIWEHQGLLHMWYSSGVEWLEHEGRTESIYVLMHATSRDGITWERDGNPCVPAIVDQECQTNPSVIALNGRYHMWFCYRYGLNFRTPERGYRIGYAWSDDLRTWHRADARSVLPPSRDGWDSEMVCYPRVVADGSRLLMFYSGNYFGRDGFGCAEGSLV